MFLYFLGNPPNCNIETKAVFQNSLPMPIYSLRCVHHRFSALPVNLGTQINKTSRINCN